VRAEWLFVAVIFLSACGSTPKPVDPPRLKAALEAESDGAKRYQRGDYVVAERRFTDAMRQFASIDDSIGSMRNRVHLARTQLAQGHAESALKLLATTPGGPAVDTDVLLLRSQALLALGRHPETAQTLASAEASCAGTCPQLSSLKILQARAAFAAGQAAEAQAYAETAIKLLGDKDRSAEAGNAWRLKAAARLAAGDAVGALASAQAALDIDRRLALPEKIAHDWLLIGDVHRYAMRDQAPGASSAVVAAYSRALEVAQAAGLLEITIMAKQALQDLDAGKIPAK
jgi:tetratricopeptide (TPR) repeat protein